jgi:probable F420-dependent oxidoreductase
MSNPHPRPFRFGVQGRAAASRAAWLAFAREAEALGYDTLLVPDHFPTGLGPVAALSVAAGATERLRLGSFVFANDFRHPALLTKEAATLDLLSDGRFELGLGAGWQRAEYEAVGLPFDPAPRRIERLEEALGLLKRLFAGGPVDHAGPHYTVAGLELPPRPVQRPHPPLLVGGGGRRVLGVAARAADIVALGPRAAPDGTLTAASITAAATAEKVGWVREAAGERYAALELNVFVYAVETTDDPRAAAERLAPAFGLPADDLLTSPHALFGSLDGIVETLRERREVYGLSYVVVPQDLMGALAPVVARVART